VSQIAQSVSKVAVDTKLGRALFVGLGARVAGKSVGAAGALEGAKVAGTLVEAWRILLGRKS
jgi:hypothetical protein